MVSILSLEHAVPVKAAQEWWKAGGTPERDRVMASAPHLTPVTQGPAWSWGKHRLSFATHTCPLLLHLGLEDPPDCT